MDLSASHIEHAQPEPTRVRTPAHLWMIGTLGLVLGGLGCFHFLVTNMRLASAIAPLAPDVVDYLDALPVWTVFAWALLSGSSVLGALLLFARSAWAVPAFALRVAALAAIQVYVLAVPRPESVSLAWALNGVGAAWSISACLLLYARRMRRRGVLR